MYFAPNSLFVLNFIVILFRDVSAEDLQEPKIKLEEIHRQKNNYDYWDIDHNEASAIYYEPADLFTEKPFEISKNFFISNPRTDSSSIVSLDKTHSSTTKEKRNLLTQNTDTSELCVNDTSIDEGSNILLDVNLASTPSSRNSETKELTAELLAIDDIQSTEKKLAECIDLHLFKNRDLIENWHLLLSESKIQMFSTLNETDIDKEVQNKCKHLEDIIENNLFLLKRSMPRRNKDITTESTTASLSDNIANKLFAKEDNMAYSNDSISYQKENPFSDVLTDSSILTSQYKHGIPFHIPNNFSILNDKPTTEINDIKTDTDKEKSNELLTGNQSNASVKTYKNIDDNISYRKSNTLDSTPQRNRGHEMAYKESEIKIPKILTKELLNGSVISGANDTESLPNDDFKDFDEAKKEKKTILTRKENVNSILFANTTVKTKDEKLDGETTPAARESIQNATYFRTEPTPPVDYSDSYNYTLASTEKVIELDLVNKTNTNDSIINISRNYEEKWSAENNSSVEENTPSRSAKTVYETTTNTDNILRASQVDVQRFAPKRTSPSSVNGTLFFDFNGNLVPTHFVQNAEGSINIAIDGKSFCNDYVMKKLQSVILLAICKSNYVTSNSYQTETMNKP